MRIGFIGLGSMGVGMAGNLIKGGHALTVWNRSADAAKPLAELGPRWPRPPRRPRQVPTRCTACSPTTPPCVR